MTIQFLNGAAEFSYADVVQNSKNKRYYRLSTVHADGRARATEVVKTADGWNWISPGVKPTNIRLELCDVVGKW